MPYQVKSGDTLSAIAAAQGISLDALLSLNPALKDNPDLLRIGQSLTLPGDSAAPAPAAAPASAAAPALGKLSEKYETGGRGPGTISGGVGDYGGVSYGSYQMSSKPDGGTVALFVARPDCPWRNDFAGLDPGSDSFSRCWSRIATEAAGDFHQAQHGFIRRTHFDPLAGRIAADLGFDIGSRPAAVQDALWSTAVQHGPNTPVVHRAVEGMRRNGRFDPSSDSFDRELIEALYAERGRTDETGVLVYFSKNSPAIQDGVKRRFQNERQDALTMLTNNQ